MKRILLAALLLAGCAQPAQPQGLAQIPTTTTPAVSTATIDAHRASTWPVPDNTLTPGEIVPGCTYPVTSTRTVTDTERKAVRDEYHYTGALTLDAVEIDHRIPHALCGADTIKNLWPEPADGVTQSGFTHNRKDDLERVIALKVREKQMTLTDGQAVFRKDWRIGWCTFSHSPADGVTCP